MKIEKVITTTYKAELTEEEYKILMDNLQTKVTTGTATTAEQSLLNTFNQSV